MFAASPSAANQILMVSDGQDVPTADLLKYMASAMGKIVRFILMPVILIEKLAIICGKKMLFSVSMVVFRWIYKRIMMYSAGGQR